jgi:hypothetical protein
VNAAFALGFIFASLLWLAVFCVGLAAIRKHQPPPRDYGRLPMPFQTPECFCRDRPRRLSP